MTTWNVYVGGFTKEFEAEVQRIKNKTNIFWKGQYPKLNMTASEGIDRLVFDDATGEVRHVGNVAGDLVSPQYLALHPTKPVLYAAEWARPSKLTAFAIAPDGALERQSSVELPGEYAVAVSIHPSGKAAYLANWGDGSITTCRLDDAGNPVDPELILRSEPRDELESHLHQVCISPSGKCLISTDLGLNEILTFEVDDEGVVSRESMARIPFPAHCSPRHVAFHPSGNTVYVNGEHDSMVHVMDAEDGVPTRIRASLPSPPPEYDGVNSCSELDLHPDGHTLYVGNRGSDCVAIFAVDADGDLSTLGHQPSLGRSPRGVRVDPSGKYLLVGNRNSSAVAVFEVAQDRSLSAVGEPVAVPAPSSLVFVSAGE